MDTRAGDASQSTRSAPLMVLAVLATIAALYFLRPILVPIILALVLAILLSPLTKLLRRILPLSSTGAAVVLFLLTVMVGLYGASLTAESLVQAASDLPNDLGKLANQVSRQTAKALRDKPFLRTVLPDPDTIARLGDRNRIILNESLTFWLAELTGWVVQGFIVLVLVLFLLAESEMLTPKLIRFFARSPGDAAESERTLKDLTHQVRSFLVARMLINLALGAVFALFLWKYGVRFPVALGLFAALTNFVPYVGQVLGGGLPALVTLAEFESLGDALIVASVYLALVTVEGYVVTPYVLGRSMDLNGTVILIACLFWGFLWGLIGLILAMPMTACLKLIFQNVPELHRWADLMSRDWQPPSTASGPMPDAATAPRKPEPVAAELS